VFRHHFRHDVTAAGAQRVAQGDLLPAGGVTRQGEIGDIGAGNQQEARDRGEEHEIGRRLVPDQGIEKKTHVGARLDVGVRRVGKRIGLSDGGHLRAGGGQRRSRLQAGQDVEEDTSWGRGVQTATWFIGKRLASCGITPTTVCGRRRDG